MLRRLMLMMTLTAVMVSAMSYARAASLATKALKGAAIGYAVKQSAGALDKFINTVTLQRGLSSRLDTKVVPVLSVGEKGYIGGAQVSGPKANVNQVKAVFQYEQNFDNGRYRIKALVPSSSINPLQLKRVQKVGVTALIDVSLSGGLANHYYSGGVGTGEVLRAAAVAVGIKAVAGSLNKVINTITFNKNGVTAIVPMASFGEKAYIGGAQISGTTKTLSTVKAVWQYENIFSDGRYRVKVLVPTNALNPLKMKRVDGIGLTAVVDTSIADQQKPKPSYRDRFRNRIKSSVPRVYIPSTRKDNGLHKGWEIGKHKGWDKKKD